METQLRTPSALRVVGNTDHWKETPKTAADEGSKPRTPLEMIQAHDNKKVSDGRRRRDLRRRTAAGPARDNSADFREVVALAFKARFERLDCKEMEKDGDVSG